MSELSGIEGLGNLPMELIVIGFAVLIILIINDIIHGRYKALTPVQWAFKQAEEANRRKARAEAKANRRRASGSDIIKGEWE